MFAYEVPLFMALLAPALIAGTWSITGMTAYYSAHPLYILINVPAFFVAMVSGQGKLERAPFDAPEAETEIVSGALVEYSGKLLAIFKMSINCEFVAVASIISAVFLPFMVNNIIINFAFYFMKTIFILALLTILRSAMARLRLDQMVGFCWKYMMPVAIAQIILNLIIRSELKL
jgi:NADH-quinone oxidoreductase subunit H